MHHDHLVLILHQVLIITADCARTIIHQWLFLPSLSCSSFLQRPRVAIFLQWASLPIHHHIQSWCITFFFLESSFLPVSMLGLGLSRASSMTSSFRLRRASRGTNCCFGPRRASRATSSYCRETSEQLLIMQRSMLPRHPGGV